MADAGEPGASVSATRLWFGLAAAAAMWLTVGAADLLIVWQGCAYAPTYGVGQRHVSAQRLSFVIAAVLFVVAFAGGIISYRNWRALSQHGHFLNARATDRREFMAALGVIISVTLGLGIVWLALPPLMVQFCTRAK